MLFHEIYGKYYHTVAKILTAASEEALTDSRLRAMVEDMAFGESSLTIPDALKSGRWALLLRGRSVLKHPPTMPLTQLQRQWLKALLLDPRIRLFQPDTTGLEDVEPLYTPDMFVYFDRYDDGDPYDNPEYIRHFRDILTAIREKKVLSITYSGPRGPRRGWILAPHHLEYSQKDDKFRLVAWEGKSTRYINLGRILECEILGDRRNPELPEPKLPEQQLVLNLVDVRNTLERAMLHFSHLRKETIRLDENHYRLTLWYSKNDETELLIRVLSFGPTLEVVSPLHFREQIRLRLEKQREFSP